MQLHSRLHKEMQECGRGEGSVGMLSVFSVFIILKAAGSAAVSAVGTRACMSKDPMRRKHDLYAWMQHGGGVGS